MRLSAVVVATTVRQDGRRARTHGDGRRAQAECRKIEAEFGLRRLRSGDHSAPRTPTGSERAKAQRRGQEVTARVWLREQAYAVAAAVRTEDQYFAVLTSLGIKVKPRVGPESGEVIGYSLAAPGDTNARGEPIWYGGSKLAPDLSINRLRERLASQPTTDDRQPTSPWHRADAALRQAHAAVHTSADSAAQAQLAAFGELLHNTATAGPAATRAELRAAARAFDRATRSAIRADHQQSTALRAAAKELLTPTARSEESAVAALLSTAVLLAIAAARWHEKRGHQQQAAAAQQSLAHLRTAYEHTSKPALAALARRTPQTETAQRYEQDVHAAVPEHAERVLADPAWPALAATLAEAERGGHRPRQVLAESAARRELDSADRPAEVLNWRIAIQPNKRRKAATDRSNNSARGLRTDVPQRATPRPPRPDRHNPRQKRR